MPGRPAHAVFLDRDGVVNRALVRDGKPYPPRSRGELEIPPDVPKLLAALKQAGFLLIVVTNQPDIARGTMTRSALDEINAQLRAALPLDDIKVCLGTSSETSACYKPNPGMLLDASSQYGIDLAGSYMIGDRWRDVGAGVAAGVFTIFIDYGYREQQPVGQDASVKSFKEAVQIVLARSVKEIA